jgi:hypothetical protein
MSKGNQIGFALTALVLIVRYCLNDYIPDDASTIWMKQAGIFHYVIGSGLAFIAAGFFFCLYMERKGKRQEKKLQALKALRAYLEANPTVTTINGKKFCFRCGEFHLKP